MTYLLLFLEFFKIGLFTFGGGYAMVPFIRETVIRYNWMTESEFYDYLGICESTPGPIATDMSTFIGWNVGGILGSIVATIGVILPSFIIIMIIAKIMKKIIGNKYFEAVFNSIKPVCCGLILSAGLSLVLNIFGYQSIKVFNFNLLYLLSFFILTIAYINIRFVFKKKVNTIAFLVLSSFVGLAIGFIPL